MANALAPQKTMTLGEGGLALVFTALAFWLDRDRRQGLHAGIRVPCLSVHRRQHRRGVCDHQPLLRAPGRACAADDRRQAQLQHGPGQVRDRRRRVLGHRRLHRRALHRLRAGVSVPQSRSALDQLRPPAAAAHLGGDLRLRRQCADRHLVLCRAAHLPRAAGRRSWRRGSSCSATIFSSSSPAPAICSASRSRRNMPSRNGTPICG